MGNESRVGTQPCRGSGRLNTSMATTNYNNIKALATWRFSSPTAERQSQVSRETVYLPMQNSLKILSKQILDINTAR